MSGCRRRTSRVARATGLLLAGAVATACSAPAPGDADTTSAATVAGSAAVAPTGGASEGTSEDTSRASLLDRADRAVEAIARRDWDSIAAMAHPERGVRFAPYGHVEPEGECTVTLARDQLAALAADSTARCWGHFDGTGEPIRMAFGEYYQRFVYDRDYEDARRGAPDERLGQGNTLSNLPGAFGPDAAFVEYHVPGTEEYGGMDWGSLRLVFAPSGGEWRLVGVVHDQWTI